MDRKSIREKKKNGKVKQKFTLCLNRTKKKRKEKNSVVQKKVMQLIFY